MNEVCYSAKDAFNKRLEDVKLACSRQDHQHAIYGTADEVQKIITQGKGIRPDCVSGLIYESEEMEGRTGRDGDIKVRNYSVSTLKIPENMNVATRDELNLFMVLANPTTLNDPIVHNCFFGRLSDIQKEEEVNAVLNHKSLGQLQEEHEMETASCNEFFGLVKGAVEVPNNRAFYPEGYEEVQDVNIQEN